MCASPFFSMARRAAARRHQSANSQSQSRQKRTVTTKGFSYCREETLDESEPESPKKEQRKPVNMQNEGTESDSLKTDSQSQTSDWQPKEWNTVHENIIEMRKQRDAPVDTMGCDKIADSNAPPEVYRFQVLLSLMLSSMTKDQVTSAAMKKLIDHGCTVENLLMTSDEKLGELIYPVGFWKKKVDYIKRASAILKEQYQGDIPSTVVDLCKLPGVGPKMSHIVMRVAWNEITGIGVDTHVHRISNRLGWVRKPTSQPEQTRIALEDWLPREYWNDINELLVGFGQKICLPVKPQCVSCLNKDICPAGRKELISKKTKK